MGTNRSSLSISSRGRHKWLGDSQVRRSGKPYGFFSISMRQARPQFMQLLPIFFAWPISILLLNFYQPFHFLILFQKPPCLACVFLIIVFSSTSLIFHRVIFFFYLFPLPIFSHLQQPFFCWFWLFPHTKFWSGSRDQSDVFLAQLSTVQVQGNLLNIGLRPWAPLS